MIDILKGTPPWVFIALIYTFYVCLSGLKSQRYSRLNQMIYPAIFILTLVIENIFDPTPRTLFQVSALAGVALAGIFFGYALTPKDAVRVEFDATNDRKLLIQGTWFHAMTLCPYFTGRYLLGYIEATHLELFIAIHGTVLSSLISYFVGSLYFGRFVRISAVASCIREKKPLGES